MYHPSHTSPTNTRYNKGDKNYENDTKTANDETVTITNLMLIGKQEGTEDDRQ